MRCLSAILILCITACLVPYAWGAAAKAPAKKAAAAPAEKAAEEPGEKPEAEKTPPETTKPSATTEAGERLEKQVAALEEKLMTLTQQDMDLQLAIAKAVMKATEALGNKPKFKLDKDNERKLTPEMREQQKILRACVQQIQALDARYSQLMSAVRTLQRDRAAAELKQRLERLDQQIQTKHRVNLTKIGDLQAQACDFKPAVGTYTGVLASLPESDKQERENLKYKIAGAHEESGDYRQALTVYKELYDAMPASERAAQLNLMLRMASLYERNSDYKKALELYQEVKRNLRQGQTVGGLETAIIRCESKLGGKGR